jgi:hypothetical protein
MGHNTAALIRFRHFIDGPLALASLNLACRDHVSAFPQRCRVDPGSLTPSRSQIRTLNSRVIRLVPPNEGCRLRSRIGAPPVASWLTPNVGDLPPSLHGNYPPSALLRSQFAPTRCIGTFGLAVSLLVPFPLASPDTSRCPPSSLVQFRTAVRRRHVRNTRPIADSR